MPYRFTRGAVLVGVSASVDHDVVTGMSAKTLGGLVSIKPDTKPDGTTTYLSTAGVAEKATEAATKSLGTVGVRCVATATDLAARVTTFQQAKIWSG